MQSPIKPLSPRAIRLARIIWWVGLAWLLVPPLVLLALSDTRHLEGDGPFGKVNARVEIRGEWNDLASIMKGGDLWTKRVHEIVVWHSSRLGTWVTRDEDLKNIAGWHLQRMLGRESGMGIHDGTLAFNTDGNADSETSTALIGLPDTKHPVTKMEYFASAFDKTWELEWEKH